MSRSVYTLDVGPPFGKEEERHVTLLHQGHPCFSTTHAGVLSVILTRFPHLGVTTSQATPFASHKTPYNALQCSKAEEYLCVFHKDELHNPHEGPLKGSRARTIVCTSYHASSCTFHQLPLPDFMPKNFTAGVFGVFIHGMYSQSIELTIMALPRAIEIEGRVYQAAVDLWWMPSPLVVHPVYVCVSEETVASHLEDEEASALPSRLNATVLAQFVALGSEICSLTVTGSTLGLAKVHHHLPLDVALWRWFPQRLAIPGPPVKSLSLTATISEHSELEEQIIFLFNSQNHTVQVLKTPNLKTEEGSFSVLFTLSGGVLLPPMILNCVDPNTPQPILVSNYPENNSVSLFDVGTLLDPCRAAPNAYLASMAVDVASSPSNRAVPLSGVSRHPSGRRECRRINGILDGEVGASTVVFSISPSETHNDAGEPATTRRRYDPDSSSQSLVVRFPTFAHDRPPLLAHQLEMVSATLGSREVWEVEYAAMREAWMGLEQQGGNSMLTLVQRVLLSSVEAALYECDPVGAGPPAASVTQKGRPDEESLATFQHPEEFLFFTDPLTMHCEDVELSCVDSDRTDVKAPAGDRRHYQTRGAVWAPESCGLLLLGMHALFESCKIQEPLWFILEPLALFNLELSRLLGWESYISFYAAVLALEGKGGPPRRPIRAIPSEEEVWTWATQRGLVSTRTVKKTTAVGSSSARRGPLELLALLRCIVCLKGGEGLGTGGGEWRTFNGLPSDHPVSMADRIHQLYVTAFDREDERADDVGDERGEEHSSLWWRHLVQNLQLLGIPSVFVHESLSLGVGYPILQAIQIGKSDVGQVFCTEEELLVIGRIDRLSSSALQHILRDSGTDVVRLAEERAISIQQRVMLEDDDDDGVHTPPDFPQTWMDTRLERAQALLNTTSFIPLSDAEVKTADKSVMEALGWRVCATTIGRGGLTMSTHDFKSCDSIPVPKLNLSGMTETGIIVPSKLDATTREEMTLWPLFHNSCAAGLRFFPLPASPDSDADGASTVVTREKLLYQWRSAESTARAGLLLSAGLLGHFQSLQLTDVYTILVSQELNHDIREITAIAVLLGLSCSYRGTNNATVFKCLSVHILSLTPSDEDVEIRLNVQTAAFVSVGLLCQGQYILSNAFLLEVFLVEMTRLPSDEHCINREGYTLGAAFGLGLVLLGVGRSAGAASLIETLIKVMEGAPRESPTSTIPAYEYFSEKNIHTNVAEQTDELIRNGLPSFSQCSRVHEGDHYNALVAGPAAVMALGLMFLKTEDDLLAKKVAPPDSLRALNSVSATMCLLRSLVAPLVHWNAIRPSKEWVYKQIPSCLNALFIDRNLQGTFRQQRQYMLRSWGHCLAGTIFALSLRYAGTMDSRAKETIVAELKGFLSHQIGSSGVPMTALQKSSGAFEMCISTCCVAASVVMAGTGDQNLLHVFQRLYTRPNVSYGVSMSVSMSVGLLFLGGGRLTLSNETSSIAALLIALYPIWPMDAKDNVRHLQALRHLYTLAVVPRVAEAIDVMTQRSLSVPIRIVLRDEEKGGTKKKTKGERPSSCHHSQVQKYTTNDVNGGESQGREIWSTTPCLYPPPDTIDHIEVCSLHHYGITISHGSISNYGLKLRLLEKSVDDTDTFSAAVLAQDGLKTAYRHHLHSVEERLTDWMKRLFRHPNTTTTESAAILDNIKILHAAQRSLLNEVHASGATPLLSLDFGRAVDKTLSLRYCSFFARGSASRASEHPLHMLLIQRLPLDHVVRHLAQRAPAGTRGFPCDFSHLLSRGCESESINAVDDGTRFSSRTSTKSLYRWFQEVLCYYDLTPAHLAVLSRYFLKESLSMSTSAADRTMSLLRLQRLTGLPYDTLREVACCCFGPCPPSVSCEGRS